MATVATYFRKGSGVMRLRSGGQDISLRFSDLPEAATNTVRPTMTLVSGTAGKIGAVYALAGGTWTGSPSVELAVYREGVLITGTEGITSYALSAADDLKSVYLRETATVEGRAPVVADSDPVAVTYAAPVASGTIPNVSRTQGDAVYVFDATPYFTGSALVWSIDGPADVTIDEGIVSVPANVVQSAVTTTVYADNSGGQASRTFTVTVIAGTPPPTGPDPIEEAEVLVTFEVDPYEGTAGVPAGAVTWMFEILSGPALAATRVWWHGNIATSSMVPGAGFHPCIPHPTTADKWIARAYTPSDLDTPRTRDWLWVNSANPEFNRIGVTVFETLIYTTDSLATPVASADFSAFSDTLTQVCNIYTPPVESLLSRRMPLAEAAEKNAGYLPGDGMQHWMDTDFCIAEPDVCYGAQDTGGIWKSIDHGATWRLPARTGLASYQSLGVCVDPADPDHVLVNASGYYELTADYAGIYRSTDGGETFARVVTSSVATRHASHKSIAFAPGSGLSSGRTAKILAIPCGSHATLVNQVFPIARSTDGGANWTTIATTWSETTYGLIKAITGDTSNDNRFYVTGSKGLIRITNAFSGTFTIAILSGTVGLPTGSIDGRAYVSSDGQTIIVGVGGKGVYKSTNGGTSFAQVGSFTTFVRLHVNPFDASVMLATTSQTSSVQTPYLSTNGGTTFTAVSASRVEARPGTTGIHMIGNYHTVCWNGAAAAFTANRETVAGVKANQWRSDNLLDWELANTGFCGCNVAIRGPSPSLFDPSNHLRFALPYVDLGPRLTEDGGLSFTPQAFTATEFTPALTELTSYGVAVHPTQDVTFVAVGVSPRLFRSTAKNSSWTEITGVLGGYTIFCDPDDPSVWFAGRKKSTNHGVTFPTTMSDLPTDAYVYGRTEAGTVLHAMWAHNIAGACDSFYRSTDKGTTWTLVLTMGYNNKVTGYKWGPWACHPTDRNVIFTKHPTLDYVIRRWSMASGTATTRPSTDLNLFGTGGTPPASTVPFEISRIAIDPRNPLVIWAATTFSGHPRLYRTEDGGATAWEVLGSDVIPLTCNINALMVSPVTGDCLVGGSNGTFVIPPPYAQTSPPTLFDISTYDNYLEEPA